MTPIAVVEVRWVREEGLLPTESNYVFQRACIECVFWCCGSQMFIAISLDIDADAGLQELVSEHTEKSCNNKPAMSKSMKRLPLYSRVSHSRLA